ncbi:uncharacterized protein LOC129227477 [Uloborus diversus]|uniref:uncharacterized protein LOC129227477 n=1 Tax=Uloborus diversus TaxID=327109 RepID=UPI00240902B1|nr:uncharacterized protein LOC129227477 [Uloborus diversus]
MDSRNNNFNHSDGSLVPMAEQSKPTFKKSRNRRPRQRNARTHSSKNIVLCTNHIRQPSLQPMSCCTCQPPVQSNNPFCHPGPQTLNSFYPPPQQSFQHGSPMFYENGGYFYRSHIAPSHPSQVNLPPVMPCPCHGTYQNTNKAINNKNRRIKWYKMKKMNKQKQTNHAGKITHNRINKQKAKNRYFNITVTSEDGMQRMTQEEKATETNENYESNEVESAIYIKISDTEDRDEFFVIESNIIHELFHISTFEMNEKPKVIQYSHSAKAVAYLLRLAFREEHPELNMETAIESYSIAMECDHEVLRDMLKKSIENDILTIDTQVAYNPSNKISVEYLNNFYESVAHYKLTDSDFGTMKQCRVTFNKILQLHWETVPSFRDFVKQSQLPCELNIESKSMIYLHGIILRCQMNEKKDDTLKIICSIRIGLDDHEPIFETKDINSQIFVQFKNSVIVEPGQKATLCIMTEGRKRDVQQKFEYSDENMTFVMMRCNTENMDEQVYLEKILYHVE